jgi:hypothetical protein
MSIELNISAILFGIEDENHADIKVEVNGNNIGECLSQFLATKPDLKKDIFYKTDKLYSDIYVSVNDTLVVLDQLGKKVKNGDKVRLMYTRENG